MAGDEKEGVFGTPREIFYRSENFRRSFRPRYSEVKRAYQKAFRRAEHAGWDGNLSTIPNDVAQARDELDRLRFTTITLTVPGEEPEQLPLQEFVHLMALLLADHQAEVEELAKLYG